LHPFTAHTATSLISNILQHLQIAILGHAWTLGWKAGRVHTGNKSCRSMHWIIGMNAQFHYPGKYILMYADVHILG